MLLVKGKKKVYRRLGYVADFCTICRTPTPFLLRRIGRVNHFYRFGFGQGELVGHDRVCEKCNTAYRANLGTYRKVCKHPAGVDELQRETFPDLPDVWGKRLAMEKKVRRSSSELSAEERAKLIRNPFMLLARRVDKQYGQAHLDKEIFLALLAAMALMAVGPVATHWLAPDHEQTSFIVSFLSALALFLSQVASAGRRYLRREVVPVLAKALRPLRPTPAELADVLAELKQLRHSIGTELKLSDLKAHLPSLR